MTTAWGKTRWNRSPWGSSLGGSGAIVPYPPTTRHPRTWGGSRWNLAPWNGQARGESQLPPISETLFAAMRAYFQSNPALSDLTEVYKNRPARGWEFPYMVVSSITASDAINNTKAYWRTKQFQFSVCGPDDVEVERLGRIAYTSLLPIDLSKYPKLIFAEGYEIVRWPLYLDRLIEQQARTVANQNMWMYMFGYEIQTGHES